MLQCPRSLVSTFDGSLERGVETLRAVGATVAEAIGTTTDESAVVFDLENLD